MKQEIEKGSPGGPEEVTGDPAGASDYAIVGVGSHAMAVIRSMESVGFDNSLLFDLGAPPDMPHAELEACKSQQKMFDQMRDRLGRPSRVFVVVAADNGVSAGSSLILLETATAFLRSIGYNSGQRLGVILAWPSTGELSERVTFENARLVLDRLVELNVKKLIDPLIISDRTNLCGLLDALSEPIGETLEPVVDVQESQAEEHADEVTEDLDDDLYGEQ